jgi:ATP-dependent DNA ligase
LTRSVSFLSKLLDEVRFCDLPQIERATGRFLLQQMASVAELEAVLPAYRVEGRPGRPDWLHEMKYDGYRLRVERDGDRVRLITRGGYNWADRHPWIVVAMPTATSARQARAITPAAARSLLRANTVRSQDVSRWT